jgi:putative flippase GtrA
MKNSFIRFILVGIVNTIVGLSCMYLFLHAAGFSYWVSTFLGNSIGACVSYILNRNFTFRSRNSVTKSAFKFVIVILCCYFISYDLGKNIVSWVLISNAFINEKWKTDIAILFGTGLYTILNYFGQKMFVFTNKAAKG